MIAVPPPNVTGALHMGHALNGSLQDVLVRLHRMRGFNTLWQPGFDHAGIATQAVVEKELRGEGTSRQELGRDAFVERVWEWLREYGGVIMSQFRRLGCSLDYERERFTMDDGYVRAVMRFFVHLYERGWMYRDNRIINWCTRLPDVDLRPRGRAPRRRRRADLRPLSARWTARAASPSRPCVRRRSSPTSRSRCTRTTSATRSLIGKEVLVPVVERHACRSIADERVEPDVRHRRR